MEVVVEDTAVHTTKKKKHTQYKQYVSLIIVWIITIVASTFEIVIGLRNNSLTLLSDGFHNFSDVLALMIAFWALWVSTKSKTDTMTYGWRRIEILGAVMNATFLLALCFYIVLESIPRFISPPEIRNVTTTDSNTTSNGNITYENNTTGQCGSEAVNGDWWYLGTAIAILLVNVFSAIIFGVTGTHGHSHGGSSHGHSHSHGKHSSDGHSHHDDDSSQDDSHDTKQEESCSDKQEGHSDKHSHHKKKKRFYQRSFNFNMKVVFLHQVGDSVSSLFVLITALLLYFFPEQHWVVYVDPAVSLLIVGIIIASVASLLRECSEILIQRVPTEIQLTSLQSELEKVKGVKSVHDLHVWKLVDSIVIASLHVGLRECNRAKLERVIQACKDVLHKFGIHSSTLQVEFLSHHFVTESLPDDCKQNCVQHCTEDWCCKQ